MPRIHIPDWPHAIEAGRERILDAALDAGVPFPHECGAGECGSCKCRLIDGEVRSERCSPDALSPHEVAQGLILACRARPVTDVTVQWLGEAAAPTGTVQARTVSVERAAPDVAVLTLALDGPAAFPYRPGQYARLRFGELPARSFSMAGQPGAGTLTFHVRVVPDGRVSRHVAERLRPGEPVVVQGPFGDACWEPGARARPLLLVAGGTGLAPILSVLDAALRDGHDPSAIHVYHGVRGAADLYARAALQDRAARHGLRFEPVCSVDGPHRRGRPHEALREDFPDLRDALVHVAGPPPMVDAVRATVTALGASPARIRADAFHPAEPPRTSLWRRLVGWRRPR